MTETLGEALPKLMTKVRDEILPEYLAIGPSGMLAVTMMRHSLDAAQKAMISGDVVEMLKCYEDLKEYKL